MKVLFKWTLWFFIGSLLGLSLSSFASASVVRMNDTSTNLELSDICDIFYDPDSKETIESVRQQSWQTCFDGALTRGYSDETLWIRIQLKNVSTRSQTRFVYFHIPWLNDIVVYNRQGVALELSSSTLPFYDRDIPTTGFTIPLTIEPAEQQTFIISVRSQDALLADGLLVSLDQLTALNNEVQLFAGILIGGILLIALYNLVLYSIVRDSNYLYYIGYSVSMLFLAGTIYGYSFHYLWPSFPAFNYLTNAATSGLSYFALILFVRKFLATQTNLPRLDLFLQILAVIAASQLALSFSPFPHQFSVMAAALFAFIGTPVILISVFYAWLKKVPSAGFVLVAYSASVVATSLFSTQLLGLIDFDLFFYRIFGVGILFEIALFSFALADKIRILRTEREQAQADSLTAQVELTEGLKQAKVELEQQVLDRTEALNQARISAERLALTDELTGLNNRRAFFQFSEALHADAVRARKIYSIIMLDIDHFKRINDTFGHAGGDLAIQAAASELQKNLRASDVCGRIGGEEFAVLLPETDLHHAKNLAERILLRLNDIEISVPNGRIRFTSSLGVSQFSVGDASLDATMASADEALYGAKESGRNCVKVFNRQNAPD